MHRSRLEFFFLGGATFLGWPFLLLSEHSTDYHSLNVKAVVIIFSILGALIFYQPHFLSTYYFNYSRGKKFIKSHYWELIIIPVFLLLGITFFILQQAYLQYLSWLYLLAIIGAGWHFLKQSLASIIYSDQLFFASNKNPRRVIFFTLISVTLYGLIRMFDLHNGAISLFGFQTPQLNIPFYIQNIVKFVSYVSLLITLFYCFKHKMAFRAYVPFLAHVIWFSQDIFLGKYFYLIPVFHGLQYFPYFIKRIQNQDQWGLKTLTLIVSSLVVIQVVPSFLGQHVEYLLPGLLIFINLHHFVMETITWRTSAPDHQN